MIDLVLSPDDTAFDANGVTLFLGGSIEAGKARDWQSEIVDFLGKLPYDHKLQVFNPRRRAWDVSWPIDDPDHIELKQQIKWELDHQDRSDILIYYFAGNTVSPITLFELGIYAHRKPIIFIQRAYLRFANVKITADYFGWDYHTNEQNFRDAIIARINDIAAKRCKKR